jgi:hypothetical protein
MMNVDVSDARRRTVRNLALDSALFIARRFLSRRAKAKPAV